MDLARAGPDCHNKDALIGLLGDLDDLIDTFYFAVTAPEVVTVTPSSGPIGVPYTLTGTSFGAYNGSYTRVLIAGATTPVSVWNDGKVQGTIPGALSAGSKECVLEIATADGGLVRSATFQFEVTVPRADG